jgi:hypothetical protein
VVVFVQEKAADDDLKYLKPLKSVWLEYTLVTDAGLKSLKALNVVDSRATGAGVAELRKALPDCKIYLGKLAGVSGSTTAFRDSCCFPLSEFFYPKPEPCNSPPLSSC